ncbi:hypothetical protein CEXT_620411 [Caerostris extrusa]|uniref:Uncharacterized protein n=1 Tax=Caerostris extrusa TaxID=172846 RepID=A0AAV4P3G0_CAEEX|nr:hypothetical protein CEXT_620411 [Caerostris extrusa]
MVRCDPETKSETRLVIPMLVMGKINLKTRASFHWVRGKDYRRYHIGKTLPSFCSKAKTSHPIKFGM